MKLRNILLVILLQVLLVSCASLLESAIGIVLGTNGCVYPNCTRPAEAGSAYCELHSIYVHGR